MTPTIKDFKVGQEVLLIPYPNPLYKYPIDPAKYVIGVVFSVRRKSVKVRIKNDTHDEYIFDVDEGGFDCDRVDWGNPHYHLFLSEVDYLDFFRIRSKHNAITKMFYDYVSERRKLIYTEEQLDSILKILKPKEEE